MAAERDNEKPARQFLLGKLSEEDRSRFEEGFFGDDEAFEEVEIAEDELLDAYVRNELPAKDRDHVEKNLLGVPRIAKRVKVARAMNRSFASTHEAVATVPEPVASRSVSPTTIKRPWLWPTSVFGRFAFAGLYLILVAGSVALFVQYLRLREQSTLIQAELTELERRVHELTSQNSENSSERDRLLAELERQRSENARLNEQVERQLDQPLRPAAILPLTLFPGGSRSTTAPDSLTLPASPAIFQFNLLLEADDYPSYKVVVTTVGGREIGQRSDVKARQGETAKKVTFRLSSTRFTPGEYVVKLSGVSASGQAEPIATYTFSVLPKTK